jgi:PLP dependent protein
MNASETMGPELASRLQGNLADVRRRIEAACARCGRPAGSVTLVAVTKYADLAWVRGLLALGETQLGENRPQQLEDRAAALGAGSQSAGEPAWHLIGHLQRNKIRKMLPIVRLIHSLDTVKVVEAVDRIAGEMALRPRVLLEVNVSGEASKDGFTPESLTADWSRLCELRHVELAGLMTMAPYAEMSEAARPVFRRLRELRDVLAAAPASRERGLTLEELSMGMTGDFEVAIEEGATLVRIGSALWEGLDGDGG